MVGFEQVANEISSVSVVVAVYNGAEFLKELTSRLTSVLSARNTDFEIIFVNDGSRDASWSRITELASTNGRVRGVDLMRNYGQHNALLAGIRSARGNVIVTIDDDLQHPPEEIPRLLDCLGGPFDLVYGAPILEQHGLFRRITSRVMKRTLQIAMGIPNARNLSAFRAFRADLRQAFSDFRGPYVSIDVMLTWGTSRIGFVHVDHRARAGGASNYTIRRLLAHAGNLLTGFSVLPLRLASLVGFAMTIFGIAIFLYVIGRYLALGGSVPGFPFLASIIAIFSGAQMFALGIIGEYLARMHFRMMDRPTYQIRAAIDRTLQ